MESTNQMMLPCNNVAGTRRRLSEEAIKSDQCEVRGVVILVVCGLYAISMFLLAKLLSSLFGSLSASVSAMLFGTKMEGSINSIPMEPQQSNLHPLARKPFKTRPVCHG